MSTLYITEFAGLARDPRGFLPQVPMMPAIADQVVTISSSSAASAAFSAGTSLIRITSDSPCSVQIAVAPVATTSMALILPFCSEYFQVAPGQKIAVIQQTAAASTPLASAVTVTGAGTGVALTGRTFTVIVSGTTASGTGAATILIQGSHDNTKWATLGTSNLSLSTTIAVDALGSFVPYGYVRINVTAISGTGAAISATVEA